MYHRIFCSCLTLTILCSLGCSRVDIPSGDSTPPTEIQDSLELTFSPHTLNAESTFSAAAIDDIDRDGDPDVFCGGFWYENPGKSGSEWTKHFVRTVEEIGGRFDGYSHLPYDVDGDGDTDFINVNYRSKSIFWVEHPGDLSKEWNRHVIGLPGSMETGFLVDVDRDGRLDILPNGSTFAAWWKASVGPTGATQFDRKDLPQEAAGHGIGFGDVNGDGRGDVIGRDGWLEGPPTMKDAWKWHPEFKFEQRASVPIVVDDVDGDGDADLMWTSAHGYGFFWEEQIKPGEWKHHIVDESWSQGHTPIWIDLDGDGQKEFVCGKRYWAHEGKDPGATDEKVIHRYQFNRATKRWERGTISRGGEIGWGLGPVAGDLDGDGDIDLVCPGRSGLFWLENQMTQ